MANARIGGTSDFERAGLGEIATRSVVLEPHGVDGTLEQTRLAEKVYPRGS